MKASSKGEPGAESLCDHGRRMDQHCGLCLNKLGELARRLREAGLMPEKPEK